MRKWQRTGACLARCPGKRSLPGLESAKGRAEGLTAPLVVQGRGVGHAGLAQQISQGIIHSAETSHCL